MAKFIECVLYEGGTAILRADNIEAVQPAFKNGEFACSTIRMSYGGTFTVNEVWEQIADAIEAEGFSVCTRPLESVMAT